MTNFRPEHLQDNTYDTDLNPQPMAGINDAANDMRAQQSGHTASDLKEVYDLLPNLSSDELREIVILSEGTRLQEGAKYIDLRHLDEGEILGRNSMAAGSDNLYVAKSSMDYQLWNRLRGVTEPERLGEAAEGAEAQ